MVAMSSSYVTPFLVLNLGAEMVFVIAQRLEAQNVAPERAGVGTASYFCSHMAREHLC